MNVRGGFLLLKGLILFSFFTGCVKDDNEVCVDTTGINILIYSRNSCQTDSIFPETVDNLILGVFNKENVLVEYKEVQDVKLSRDFTKQIEVPPGLYTVIAWSGLYHDSIELMELNKGITRKDELLFRLRVQGNQLSSITGNTLFFGESTAVYIPENQSNQPRFEEVAVNITEITNRITITIEGVDADDIEIAVESAGYSMNMNGSFAPGIIREYIPDYTLNADYLEAGFTLLKLVTGNHTSIIVRNTNSPVNEELFRGDLLGTLLFKNPEVNLACDHDFTIRFTIEDQCDCGTYTITEIWVNNWLVHSYDTEM